MGREKFGATLMTMPCQAAVFELLATVVNLCPQLEFVIFEQLGHTLGTASSQAQFRRDYQSDC